MTLLQRRRKNDVELMWAHAWHGLQTITTASPISAH